MQYAPSFASHSVHNLESILDITTINEQNKRGIKMGGNFNQFRVVQYFVLGLIIIGVNPFSDWMTKDFCSRSLKVGEIIMNEEVVQSEERNIKVFRDNGEEVFNGAKYRAREKFIISLDDTRGQYVYEVSHPGKLVDGGCDGRRIANEEEIDMEIVDSLRPSKIYILAAWASGHSQVKVSKPFYLTPEQETIHFPSQSNHSSESRLERDWRGKVNKRDDASDHAFLIKKVPKQLLKNNTSVNVISDENSLKMGNLRSNNHDHLKSTNHAKLPQNTIDAMKKNYQRKIIKRKGLDGETPVSEEKRIGHYAKMQRHHSEKKNSHVVDFVLNGIFFKNVVLLCLVAILLCVCSVWHRLVIIRFCRKSFGGRYGKD